MYQLIFDKDASSMQQRQDMSFRNSFENNGF